jgi:hypothetical protein
MGSARVGFFVGLTALQAHAAPAQASGGSMAGTQLSEFCKGPPLHVGTCIGFINGVADSCDCSNDMHGFRWNSDEPGITVSKLRAVVEKFLKDHPEVLNKTAASLVAAALQEAFPCP